MKFPLSGSGFIYERTAVNESHKTVTGQRTTDISERQFQPKLDLPRIHRWVRLPGWTLRYNSAISPRPSKFTRKHPASTRKTTTIGTENRRTAHLQLDVIARFSFEPGHGHSDRIHPRR